MYSDFDYEWPPWDTISGGGKEGDNGMKWGGRDVYWGVGVDMLITSQLDWGGLSGGEGCQKGQDLPGPAGVGGCGEDGAGVGCGGGELNVFYTRSEA